LFVGVNAGIVFGPPSYLGIGYDCAGFQGFDDWSKGGVHALGLSENGWRGTKNGGATWEPLFGVPTQGNLHCTDWPAGGKGTNEQKCLHGNDLHDNFTYVYNEGEC
jgi:hypothetical protein